VTSQDVLFIMRTGDAADLRACFPGLSEGDIIQMLCTRPDHAGILLQQCFDCDMADAKAAWNDFVLRYVDGRPTTDRQRTAH
jgi:hypothetical protein